MKKEVLFIIFLPFLLLLLGCAPEQDVVEITAPSIVVEGQPVIPEEAEETREATVTTVNVSETEPETNRVEEIPTPQQKQQKNHNPAAVSLTLILELPVVHKIAVTF